MGENADDIEELEPPVKIWVGEVLPLAGMTPTASGGPGQTVPNPGTEPTSPKIDAPKTPTAASVMLQNISAPRPIMLSVPDGSNDEETKGIEAAYLQLVEHLKSHDGAGDLKAAEMLLRTLESAVLEVPKRIAKDIHDRKELVLGALAQLKVPEGLPETERAPLREKESSLLTSITEAKGMDSLETLSKDVSDHGDRLREAGEAVLRRTKLAEVLRLRLERATPPEQGLPDETVPLGERNAKLLQSLAPPLTDTGLQQVEMDTGLLETDIAKLTETVTQRGEKAESLRQRLSKIIPAVGLPVDEASTFASQVTAAGLELKAPYSPDMLVNVEKSASELELAAQQQVVAVSDRAKRAETLKLRLDKIKAPPRVTPEEAKTLQEEVDKSALLLAVPHAVLTLDGVERTAGELEGQVVTLADKVGKRDERAKAVSLRMTQLVNPVGVNDTEKENMKNAREAASLLLVDPPTETALAQAETKATVAEELGKTITTAISERVKKRKELTDELDKLDIPATARPTDFRLRAKAGAETRKMIADANAADTLVKVEQALVAEKKIVADLLAFVIKRDVVEQEVLNARAALVTAEGNADQGFITKLRNTIFDVTKALPAVSTEAELIKLQKTLSDVLLLRVQSEAYSTEFRDFLTGSSACLEAAVATDQPAVTAAINKVKLAAQAKALTCDYVEARKALATFDTEAGLVAGALDDGKLWITAAQAFTASHGSKIKLIKGSQVPGGKDFLDNQVTPARAVPPAGSNVPGKIKDLNNLKPTIDKLYDVALLWQRYKSQKTKALPLAGVDLALSKVEANLNLKKYDDALKDFAPLKGTAFETKATDKDRLDKLRGKKDSVLGRLVEPQKTFLTGKYDTAKNAVDSAVITSVDANLAMDALEAQLTALEKWVPIANEVKAMAAKFANTYNLLGAANTQATANDYAKAEPLLQTAKAKLIALREAEDLMRRAEALRDTQIVDSPTHKAFVKAITDAKAALTTDKDPGKAVGLLKPVVNDPVLKVIAAEIAVWQSRYPAAEKATKRAADMMDLPAPKKVLTDSLAAAKSEADLHKYGAALDLLDLHEPVLKLAASYASVRKRALGMFAALLRAEIEFPAETAKIFGAKGKPALVKIRDDAEVLAAKTDFAAATKAVNDLIDECKGQAFETAKLFEAKDAVNTNAGHALESHGAHTKEEDHLLRLQTGVAPDGRPSKTKTTTQFTDPAVFLAAREYAIGEAPNDPPPPPIDLSKKEFPPNVDEALLKKTVPIDHGEGIGKALIGVKLADELLPDGSLEEADRKFETWQSLSGISKSKTVFTFEFDSPDSDSKSPKGVEDYKKRFKRQKEHENKQAKDLYDLKPPPKGPVPIPQATVPLKLPGRWVVMQNFPEAAGWDQEKGDYAD